MKVNERPARVTNNVPTPKPRPSEADALPTPEAKGWKPGTQGQPPQSQPTMNPVNGKAAASAMLDSVRSLAPMGITGVDPLQLLDGVKDGQATISIPMQPGHYKVKGVGFDVAPGTVAKVQVEVKDGRIVPAVDANGRETGRGTKVEIDPPLDLPLWLTGNGAYVQDKGKATAAFKADIGGFFDLKMKGMSSTKLSDVVKGFTADTSGKSGTKAMPNGLFRTDQVTFDAHVSMRDNVVTAGAAKVDLAPGTKLSLSGNTKRATLDGQVNLDSASLNQNGTQLKLGPGSAHLHADYSTAADGTMKLSTKLTNVNARIEGASIENPRGENDTDPDRIELGNATINNGSFSLDATLRSKPGSLVPEMTGATMALKGETEGSLMGAKLTLKDAQDTAELKLGPGRFKGTLDTGPKGSKLDGSITGTSLDVKDLQTKNANATMGVQHGHFEGDLKLQSDSANGVFNLDMDAKKVDLRIAGYQGRSVNHNVDFERIDVAGAGKININSKTGTNIDGDMTVKAAVNDLAIGKSVDITQGSTLDGSATHFHAGGQRGFELTGKAKLDAQVGKLDIATGGVTMQGAGRMRGDAQFDIRKGQVALTVKKGTVDLNVADAKVGDGTSAMGLDVAKGSTAKLKLDEASFGRGPDGVEASVKLGPGSVIDATLDEGHVTVSGKKVKLDAGAHARFEMSSLDARTGEAPSLKGKLSVQAGVSTSDLTGLDVGGIKLSQAGTVKGKVSLEVPNVTLRPDGVVSYRDAHVSLDARIGDAKVAAKPAPATALPKGVLSEEQVKAQSAAQIAGTTEVGRPKTYDPLDAARRVKNGTVELDIPVEGRLGEGYWKSADFSKGTTLKLKLVVKDGKVVPSETKATFSKAGDGALWVTAKGAYLDSDNTLRLELGGMKDFAVPGMENLPTDIDSLVTRLQQNSKGGSGGNMDALKFSQAQLNIENAQFTPGKMSVPGGWIDIGPSTKLSVRGSMTDAVLSGKVELNGVDITQSGVALKGSKGSTDLSIAWKNGIATTTLDHLNVDTRYAVQKRENGDYLNLAQGRVTDGRLVMKVPVNAAQLTAGMPTSATLDIPRFSGTVEGARLTAMYNGKRTQLEIGNAQVDGEMHIADENIEIKGTVTEADVAIRGLRASTTLGGADVDSARMVGSGTVDFSSTKGVSFDANVSSLDVRATKANANVAGTNAAATKTRITGSGHVAWSSGQNLTLEGDLHVDATMSGEVGTRGAFAPAKSKPVKRVTVQRAAVVN